MTRDEFLRLYHGGRTLREAAAHLGLTDEQMGAALLEASFNAEDRRREHEKLMEALKAVPIKPAPTDPIWCDQCERLVKPGEFMACRRQFCKAKVAA